MVVVVGCRAHHKNRRDSRFVDPRGGPRTSAAVKGTRRAGCGAWCGSLLPPPVWCPLGRCIRAGCALSPTVPLEVHHCLRALSQAPGGALALPLFLPPPLLSALPPLPSSP